MYRIKSRFWEMNWQLKNRINRIKCWFVGHDLVWVDETERFYGHAAYCSKCYVDWPTEQNVLPAYLGRIYSWFIRRDWGWFEQLDLWLLNNHSKRLPKWWEY